MTQPTITRTTHTLPFDKLSPRDFERLCLWLVEREGYGRAERPGAARGEQRLNVGNTNLAHRLDAGYNTCRKMTHQYKANSGVMM